MTAPAAAPLRRISSPFVPVGPGVLINRTAEAERLAGLITQSASRFVVLYGQPASGKTTLVKHWLVPALQAVPSVGRDHVFYAPCTTAVPDVVEGQAGPVRLDDIATSRAIVILDEFDQILDAPRDERRRELDRLFERLHRRDCLVVIVAVVSERQLTSVYALTSYEPAIASAVEPIGAVSVSEGLQRLCIQQRAARRISYSADALAAIEADAKARDLDPTFDFVKLIHARFAALVDSDAAREIGIQDYAAVGKLEGILREHVEQRIDAVEAAQPGVAAIARAILVRVLEAQARGASVDVGDIGPRFGVATADAERVLASLVDEGLLVATGNGQYQFQPPQAAAIVETDRAARDADNERVRRMVVEGLRSWQQLGTLLPPARFVEIHRQRRSLTLDDASTRFLLQCALRQEQPELSAAPAYWLGRVASGDDGMDVLLSALFDASPTVRSRAATLLARYADPLVRDRLCVLALSDPAAEVRTVAIDSLASMTSDELLATLRHEAENPRSTNREQAIEALRLFPRPEVTALLQSLVNDRATPAAIRERAIAVLAAIATRESVDALVAVALEDPDHDDRRAAASALATTPTDDLNRHLLSRLGWRRPILRIVGMILVLSIVLYAGVIIVAVAAAFASAAMGGDVVGRALFGLIALTVVTGLLLIAVEEDRIRRRSFAGVLSILLFIVSSLTYAVVLHGLSHLMVRRTRRAVALFGLEMAGLACYFVVAAAAESITGLEFLATIYRAIGVVLFGASYLYDVLRIALDLFVMRGAMSREARRSAIYDEIFANPIMTTTVIADLGGSDAKAARRSRRLVRRFGDRMSPAALVEQVSSEGPARRYVVSALARAKDDPTVARLASMWTTATASAKRAIASSLARSPTAAAVQALSRLAADGGAWLRVRAWIAKLQFSLDVWPRPAQAAIVLVLPVAGMLLYHGGMMMSNHAWGEIILLRQPVSSPERKVRIVDFLVDVYPDQSVDELRRLFSRGRRKPIDPVHAAVTRGLVKILDSTDLEHRDPLRRAIASEMVRYDSLLRAPDSAGFVLAIGVLGTMARSSDSTFSAGAIQLMTAAADTIARTSSGSMIRVDSAVQALSRVRYDRALPALAKLLKAVDSKKAPSRADADLADLIKLEMNRVASQAFAALSPGDAAGREQLRRTLVAFVPSRTGNDLVDQLQRQQLASQCDRNGDGRCDDRDEALQAIDENPATESGYRELYRHYATDTAYRDAAAAFTRLAEQHAQSIWPRKILAEVYHENLAGDPRSFARAYDEMLLMRRLPAYDTLERRNDADYRRVESDFAEIALSARHPRDLELAASAVVGGSATPTQRLNMALFLYIASVVDHDVSAPARLVALERVVDSLPKAFYNEWAYPGTRAYIQQTDMPDSMKSAILELCREGDWYAPAEAKRIIALNRRELSTAVSDAKARR